jgi:hypothetical protein
VTTIDNRLKTRIDADSRKVLALIKRRNGIKTDSEAINLAIRMAGTQMHIADVNETNELLHQIIEASASLPNIIRILSDNTQRNEKILLRTFAYLRRMISEMDGQHDTQWLDAAENDFVRHITAKTNKGLTNE